jgi:hypothetical protein
VLILVTPRFDVPLCTLWRTPPSYPCALQGYAAFKKKCYAWEQLACGAGKRSLLARIQGGARPVWRNGAELWVLPENGPARPGKATDKAPAGASSKGGKGQAEAAKPAAENGPGVKEGGGSANGGGGGEGGQADMDATSESA